MGAFGGASLEHSYPRNGWMLAPDKPFSNFSPSAMLFGGSSGLMQKPHSDCISLQQALKQEPVSSLHQYSAPISSLHQLPNIHESAPILPFFGPVNDWSRAGNDPIVFGRNSGTKVPGKNDLLSYSSSRTLPVLYCDRGEFMDMSKMTPKEIIDAKALAASKSHSEAERRRRLRINTHMTTLRSLLPSTIKTDKASLLAEVVHHVSELKRHAAEIAQISPVPSDVDELDVDMDSSLGEDSVIMKASLCCDDRPGLLLDIAKALKDLKLQPVKAEIATLGGRVKHVMLIRRLDCGSCKQEGPSLTNVQEALRAVMEKPPSNEIAPPNFFSDKRQRTTYYCA